MRIISGYAKGMKLKTAKGRAVRPTGDRVKEGIFSVLGDLTGAVVVDLFAGCGGLGIEAVSRGAGAVHFIEKARSHVRIIGANLDKLKACFPADNPAETRVIQGDALTVHVRLASLNGKVDVVFADPPYRPERGESGPETVLESEALRKWIGDGILVLEHAKVTPLDFKARGWRLLKQKTYGDTAVSFAQVDD